MFKDAPAYEPGAYFQYASLTYLLLNAVVLRLLGKRMSEFLSEYVFGPCGMADTGFHPVDPARAMPLMGHPADTPEKLRRYGDLELSGSGLWSTVEDLVRMGQALLTPGRLLSRDAFERHTRSQPSLPSVAGDRSSRRTWGWNREPQAALPRQPDTGFYHGGATGTLLWLDPARDLIFVFLSTRWGSGNEHAFGTLSVLYDDAGSPLPGTPQSA
jgi:CubicO group peptidase (beta-lactamase class C family)